MKNVFENVEEAIKYDAYYTTEFGKKVDKIEKKIIVDFLSNIPKTNMLELGCGTGHWTAFFVQAGFKVTGVDSSEAMLDLAKTKNMVATFVKADAANLPFEDNSFGCVSSITMLEFVEDADAVLNEIKRVLKPDGFLLLGCLNADSVLGKNKQHDPVFRDARFLTPDELIQKLSIFGTPEINMGVCLTNNMQLVDNTVEAEKTEPVFMAALVKNN